MPSIETKTVVEINEWVYINPLEARPYDKELSKQRRKVEWVSVDVLKQALPQNLNSFKGLRWGFRFYQELGYRITDDENDEKILTKAMDNIIEQFVKSLLGLLEGAEK